VQQFWILMKQEIDKVAVASARPYANHLHLDPDRKPRQHLSFNQPDALPDAQPTASKH